MRRNFVFGLAVVALVLFFAVMYPSLEGVPARIDQSRSIEQLDLLAAAEEAHFKKHGEYLGFGPYPAEQSLSGNERQTALMNDERTFAALGWRPPAETPCRFAVAASRTAFTAEMECASDESAHPVYVGIVRPENGQRDGIRGPFGKCPTAGVLSSRSIQRLEGEGFDKYRFLPGACDERSARVMQISQMQGGKP